MEPYEGTHPYLFISYSHKDRELVGEYINILQKNLCYLWYDKGNHAGDDWAENIARHLVDSTVFLIFISKNSVASINVNSELTMALNYQKTIIPVYLDDVRLPLGWEIKLGCFHAISVCESSKVDINALLREIPREVFKRVGSPFYKNDKHSFYFVAEELRSGFVGKLSILCETDGKKEVIWTHTTRGPFELLPHTVRQSDDGEAPVLVNIQCELVDDFFNMKGNGCVIFSVRISILLQYPLYGPDGDGIILFALVNPLGKDPKIKVLDSMVSLDAYGDFQGYEYEPDELPSEPKYQRILEILPKD